MPLWRYSLYNPSKGQQDNIIAPTYAACVSLYFWSPYNPTYSPIPGKQAVERFIQNSPCYCTYNIQAADYWWQHYTRVYSRKISASHWMNGHWHDSVLPVTLILILHDTNPATTRPLNRWTLFYLVNLNMVRLAYDIIADKTITDPLRTR